MKRYEVITNGGGLQYVDGDTFTVISDGVLVWLNNEPIAYFPSAGFISLQAFSEDE